MPEQSTYDDTLRRDITLLLSSNVGVSEWVNEWGLTSPATHYSSFRRRVFPVNHLHWYWDNRETMYIFTHSFTAARDQRTRVVAKLAIRTTCDPDLRIQQHQWINQCLFTVAGAVFTFNGRTRKIQDTERNQSGASENSQKKTRIWQYSESLV